ncbi:MAG: elongation factor 4 [Verrucomicrobia bacterium]|nr:elongation factor 4 [Verrucomicrobiota bacterium]MCH8528174.1 translation elongation factor 4 [Kiritimatiellia bacterium]
MPDLSRIRNFSIIAHIDHGKSTLADRILEMTHAIDKRNLQEQMLDDMDLERERGITIKAHPVSMLYKADDGETYQFNLIDTPGHVDFAYEVTRSLASCEGAILVVDAAQGVEAQTVANVMLAMEQELAIIPVLNKIDLPNANVPAICKQVEDLLAIPMEDALLVSAKTGQGIEAVLEAIVKRVPPPTTDTSKGTRALVFDSYYDAYRGVVSYVRVFDGELSAQSKIRLMSTGKDFEVKEVGVFTPDMKKMPTLRAGETGYIIANIKESSDMKIGDTVTRKDDLATEMLPGFKEVHPMVFSGLYPVDGSDYEKLKHSLEKLSLNDAAFTFQAESSVALGFGFRCGFLGLLHMEIIQERLRREYELDIISTYPGVVYEVFLTNGDKKVIDNPINLPDPTTIDRIEEPFLRATILCPNDDIGEMMNLIRDRRGEISHTDTVDGNRLMLTCHLPLNEIVVDFYDKLKSISHGYASMDYEYEGYRENDLVKMDILVHGEPVDAFACIVHREKAVGIGRNICKKLVDEIPRMQFAIAVQAALGRNIIARETVPAFRKDVTSRCYGGDISRKRKLLENQKAGKKKMKMVGKVNIPQEAFMKILKSSD